MSLNSVNQGQVVLNQRKSYQGNGFQAVLNRNEKQMFEESKSKRKIRKSMSQSKLA